MKDLIEDLGWHGVAREIVAIEDSIHLRAVEVEMLRLGVAFRGNNPGDVMTKMGNMAEYIYTGIYSHTWLISKRKEHTHI